MPRGGAPPGPENAKTAGVETGGNRELQIKGTVQSAAATLTHSDGNRKSSADWRRFFDNARGCVDDAIKAVWIANGNGLLTDEDATEIDAALRSKQAAIAPKSRGIDPAALHKAAHKVQHQARHTKSKFVMGWERRRPRVLATVFNGSMRERMTLVLQSSRNLAAQVGEL